MKRRTFNQGITSLILLVEVQKSAEEIGTRGHSAEVLEQTEDFG